MNNPFDGVCGRIAPGLCRFSMGGRTAVKTSHGYRCYDPDRKALINCDHFAIDAGDDFFFVIPSNNVQPGDIILAGDKPKCVLSKDKDTITVINFEDATVETILPERHVFMGNTYLYGKIVSVLGKQLKGGKGMNGLMKYMMLAGMLKGREGASSLLPLLLLGGKNDFFDGLMDDETDMNDEEA